jgi:hypothetical protein
MRFTFPSARARFKKSEKKFFLLLFSNLLLLATQLFGLMWSTHAGWFQHLLTLSKLLPEFSFPHNFGSIGPKIIIIVLLRSLF